MNIKYIENATETTERFKAKFVMPWEAFRVEHKDWIRAIEKKDGNFVGRKWYDGAYMWGRLISDFEQVSFDAALCFLREQREAVLFIAEKCGGDGVDVAYAAEADANELAGRVERDWYESFRLMVLGRYDPDELEEDIYVFDASMRWCVIFTHENEHWELELEEPMRAARSRYCLIYRN